MARTAQSARARRDVCKQHFEDHAGKQALRYGYRNRGPADTSTWPPTDYAKNPKFCFQVYLSVDLGLDDDEGEEPDVKRARGADGSYSLNDSKLMRLTQHLCVLSDIQRPNPLWEFYVMPGASSLDFIAHSRHEILHRKKLRAAGDVSVPLIPRIAAGMHDQRKTSFLFAIDNEHGWNKANDRRIIDDTLLKWPNKSGPLWARFDPCLPTSIKNLDREWQTAFYVRGTDDIDYYSEQLDVETQRIQHFEQSFLAMQMMYPESIGPAWLLDETEEDGGDNNGGMDFGGDLDDEMSSSQLDEAMRLLTADASQTKLDSRNITIEQNDDTIKLFNTDSDSEPIVRYIVYVPFLHDRKGALKDVARVFTASFLDSLPDDISLHLTFHTPAAPADASIVASFRNLRLPEHAIGTLTELQAQRRLGDPVDVVRPKEPHYRRLHPINIQPHIFFNDPATSQQKPFSTFIVVLDRPDFKTLPAIRILLADGEPYRENKADNSSAQDYIEILSWRSARMEDVVRRLTLTQPQPQR